MKRIQNYITFQHFLPLAYALVLSIGLVFLVFKLCAFFSFSSSYFYLSSILIFIATFAIWYFRFSRKQAISVLHAKNQHLNYKLDAAFEKENNWLLQNLKNQLDKEKLHLDFKQKSIFAGIGICCFFVSAFIPKKAEIIQKESTILSTSKTQFKTKAVFKVEEIEATILPPAYTQKQTFNTENLNITAPEDSKIKWRVKSSFDKNHKWYIVNEIGLKRAFSYNNNRYFHEDVLISSGLYSLQVFENDSILYQSPYYTLEAIKDESPEIIPREKNLYTVFDPKKSFSLPISAEVKDDYSVKNVQIIATLARGEGENVKFREKSFMISSTPFKSKNLNFELDLKALKFEPGDELFYYWLAVDNKWPEPNFKKSDTYFIKYKDPKAGETTTENTMALNILPEYFRSQRQIIIDTEKLIRKRNKIKPEVFNETSNEIGFDQKSLRIRYGQYLGEEFESNIGHAEDTDDPLASFTHDHDSSEHEDEAVAAPENHSHGGESKTDEQDPLAALMEQYVHSHDDGEMNTFYEKSTQALLKSALEQMWQAELHLRLNDPEKALPFENVALRFLKEAQQKARAYVKKSGFDPSPIKEKEKRLSGKLEKVNPDLSFLRLLKTEELANLSAATLGLIEKTSLASSEKQVIVRLINLLPEKSQIKNILQKKANDATLNQTEKEKIVSELLSLNAYQKSNNALPLLYDKNKDLRNAFLKIMN
jgi:hypothetical protein